METIAEKAKQKLGVGQGFEATGLPGMHRSEEEAARYAEHLRRYERAVRRFEDELQGFMKQTTNFLDLAPTPHTYHQDPSLGGDGLIRDPNPLRELDDSQDQQLGQAAERLRGLAAQALSGKLESELLLPIRTWLDTYDSTRGEMSSLDKARLKVDARRRRVDSQQRRAGSSSSSSSSSDDEGQTRAPSSFANRRLVKAERRFQDKYNVVMQRRQWLHYEACRQRVLLSHILSHIGTSIDRYSSIGPDYKHPPVFSRYGKGTSMGMADEPNVGGHHMGRMRQYPADGAIPTDAGYGYSGQQQSQYDQGMTGAVGLAGQQPGQYSQGMTGLPGQQQGHYNQGVTGQQGAGLGGVLAGAAVAGAPASSATMSNPDTATAGPKAEPLMHAALVKQQNADRHGQGVVTAEGYGREKGVFSKVKDTVKDAIGHNQGTRNADPADAMYAGHHHHHGAAAPGATGYSQGTYTNPAEITPAGNQGYLPSAKDTAAYDRSMVKDTQMGRDQMAGGPVPVGGPGMTGGAPVGGMPGEGGKKHGVVDKVKGILGMGSSGVPPEGGQRLGGAVHGSSTY
jgi:hypothetical protein